MAVTRRNYLDIYNDGRTRIKNNSPVNNFNQQGTTKALLDTIAVEGEQLYDGLESISTAIDPTNAIGGDLDKIGFSLGEYRNSSLRANDTSNTNFLFYIDYRLNWTVENMILKNYNQSEINVLINQGYLTINEGIYEITIPKGTVVSNGTTVEYTTIQECILGDGAEVYCGVIATDVGQNYNIGSNQLVQHSLINVPELRRISSYIKCTNRYPIQNGKYSMDDEEFRYKISTARSSIASNELAMRRAALSVAGVRDILFQRNKYGNGTVNILVDGISPLISNGLMITVRESISNQSSNGDVVYVDKPEYIGVELRFNITTIPGVDSLPIRNQARNSIIQYINDLPIGGEIIWTQIVAIVGSIDGVLDFIPDMFKLGEYDDFNKINRNQKVVRFLSQKAATESRFYTDTGLINCCITQ